MGLRHLSAAEQDEVWAGWRRGESLRAVARRLGKHFPALRWFVAHTGGVRAAPPRRAAKQLSAAEREEISRGLAAGDSCRVIAARLGRDHTTVSREVARNGGRAHYRAARAEAAAWRRAKRPKAALLARRPALRAVVEDKLAVCWSPQQIAGWLRRTYPDDPTMRVSHETTYLSLFVQTRGALRRELARHLRTGRRIRYPRAARRPTGRGRLLDVVSIRERPAEAEDRAVPGHWEGDLVFGRRPSAVGTGLWPVERTTRYLMLFPVHGDGKAPRVREALAAAVARLPEHLRRSLAWDHGKEMAEHVRFTVDTGVQVYFCDLRSPWQRGTNENTNGLLRQYLPQRSDFSGMGQAELDAIAAELNGRPRQTLGWRTPAERFLELAGAG